MGLTFDGLTKVITLTTGTTSLSVRELWSRWTDWFLTSDNSKYLPAFSQVGGDDIDPIVGTTIPIYAFLMNGWKLKPQESNHTLTISDGILLVDGGGDPFNNTTGAYTVRINYQQPVQAITVSTGGGSGLTPADIWTHDERTLSDASNLGLASASSIAEISFTLGEIQSAVGNIDVADILSLLVEGEYTLQDILQIISAVLFGKLSGGDTTTLNFRSILDDKNRVVATINQDTGDRLSVIVTKD